MVPRESRLGKGDGMTAITKTDRAATPGRFGALAAFGFSVFPIGHPDHDGEPAGRRGKTPTGPWKNYQETPATPEKITLWDSGLLNVGLATGAVSGVVVFDIDSPEVRAEIDARGFAWPRTPTVKTGRGWHVYFAHPGPPVGNKVNLGDIEHLDFRGDGGYAVGPGSRHENGALYAWEISPEEAPFAPAPAWLWELHRKAKNQPPDATDGKETPPAKNRTMPAPGGNGNRDPYAEAALRAEVDRVKAQAQPGRNDTLNRAAFSLGQLVAGGILDRGTVEAELTAAADSCGLVRDDGAGSVDATIRSGIESGMLEPRTRPEPRTPARRPASETQYHEKPETLNPENPETDGWQLQPDPPGAPPAPRRERPIIEIRGGELPAMVVAAEEALLDSTGPRIYQRGGILVRAVRYPAQTVKDGITRPAGALGLAPLDSAYLVERLTVEADWNKWDARERKHKRADCPDKVALTYLARAGLWRVPALVAVIEAPTLRPTGSILDAPGYDEETGLLLDTEGARFDPIPDNPTTEAVTAAAALFRDLLGEFPFVEECDRAAALAAICTALVRRSLPSAPMFAFRAPKMRSGKTMLADCVALIATSRPCAVMSQAETQTAEQKRLLAALLNGDSVICYDNVDREFGGAAISQALTQATITDRLLGFSRMVTAPTAATFLATGNNLTFAGDITCRVVPCDLDPQREHPEERTFMRNLYEWIPQHRGRLVAAALTILRGYQAAGRPEQRVPAWAGFDAWSKMVREAVVWAGFADPAAGRPRLEETDPVRVQLAGLLSAWREYLPDTDGGYTASDLDRKSKPEGGGKTEPPAREALRAALLVVAGARETIDTGRLGRYLRDSRNRIEAGLVVRRAGETHGVTRWRVVEAPKPGGGAGMGGDVSYLRGKNGSEKEGIGGGDTAKNGTWVENNPTHPPTPPPSVGRVSGNAPEASPPAWEQF
jgi:hypothetical protein